MQWMVSCITRSLDNWSKVNSVTVETSGYRSIRTRSSGITVQRVSLAYPPAFRMISRVGRYEPNDVHLEFHNEHPDSSTHRHCITSMLETSEHPHPNAPTPSLIILISERFLDNLKPRGSSIHQFNDDPSNPQGRAMNE
jgi:hypothetical protein